MTVPSHVIMLSALLRNATDWASFHLKPRIDSYVRRWRLRFPPPLELDFAYERDSEAEIDVLEKEDRKPAYCKD